MSVTVQEALDRVNEMEAKTNAFGYGMSVVYYDGDTIAPPESTKARGEFFSAMTELMYKLSVNPEIEEAIYCLADNADKLDERTNRRVEILKEDYDRSKKIPMEEQVEYARLQNEATAVWHEAKENNDYDSFAPLLEKMVETNVRFNSYTNPGEDPYEVQLNRYEKGSGVAYCDRYFDTVRKSVVPLLAATQQKEQPDASFLEKNHFPEYIQKKLSKYLMDLLTLDPRKSIIGETEHPFTSGLCNHDVRITTHYYEDKFESSMYSVIHESGHALYELGVSDEIADSCLGSISSMSMHESQSRFFENIIGRSREFCGLIMPKLKELFPEQFAGITAEQLYRAVNRANPSLIRTEADELTYSLHIMVRYEIEKMLFAGKVKVGELPELWNSLYKQYLGVDVPDNKRGVLQDTHWAGGLFGYFPSYSIGSAYGAQMYHTMSKDIDIKKTVASGDLAPICGWLRERMWKYGAGIRSGEVINKVCGEDFDPKYYVDYLTDKYTEIYSL